MARAYDGSVPAGDVSRRAFLSERESRGRALRIRRRAASDSRNARTLLATALVLRPDLLFTTTCVSLSGEKSNARRLRVPEPERTGGAAVRSVVRLAAFDPSRDCRAQHHRAASQDHGL